MKRRIFDWREDCPKDVARPFPPVAGGGRGKVIDLETVIKINRKLRDPKLTSPERPT